MASFAELSFWSSVRGHVFITQAFSLGTDRDVMIFKVDERTIVREFDSHWVAHTSGLVSQQSSGY